MFVQAILPFLHPFCGMTIQSIYHFFLRFSIQDLAGSDRFPAVKLGKAGDNRRAAAFRHQKGTCRGKVLTVLGEFSNKYRGGNEDNLMKAVD